MNPTTTNSSATFHKSKIPTPKAGNFHAVRPEITPSGDGKISFEKGKSGGELKQRLASAVSAKIAAANRDGRTANTNRGIGYLLQRKQQQHDSKLNTKAISFQKPLRDSRGEEAGNADGIKPKNGGNLGSGAKDLSKPASQKSLLSALMSSRNASGTLHLGEKPAVKPRPNPTPNGGRPTLGSKNMSKPDKGFPNGTAAKVDDKDSRTLSSSLQDQKVEKPVVGAKGMTSYRNGQQDKGRPSLLTKKIPNSTPRDIVGSRNIGVNIINSSQIAKKNALLTKNASPDNSRLSENENPGNSIRTDSKTTSKLEISSSRNAIARKSSPVSKKHDKFHEDLLEKLEADVGSCKIAAFQSMEDFSVLRMRVYRIRGDLEQLKKERERRIPV